MKLVTLNEPMLSFSGDNQHVDIRAGMTQFGAFDKGSQSVPVPIRVGVVGTTATADGVRDWLEQCKTGVASDEVKLRELRPTFPGMTAKVFGTTLELSDSTTRTVSRHELMAALNSKESLKSITDLFTDHARDLSAKSGLHVLVIAPPPEVFDLGDIAKRTQEPPLDEAQEPVAEQEAPEPTPFNFHDAFNAQAQV